MSQSLPPRLKFAGALPDVIARADLPPEAAPLVEGVAGPAEAMDCLAAASFLSLGEPPTAFICATEICALGTLAGLKAVGRRAGRDVTVVSRDSTAMTAHFDPPLTSYLVSMEHIGQRLIEMLLARINGADAATLQEIVKVEEIERADDKAPG